MENKKIQVAFAATNKEWEEVIPRLTEIDSVKDYIL